MADYNNTFLQTAGIPDMKDASVVIVHTEWNAFIVDELVKGCREILAQYQVSHIAQHQVPGAIELTFACQSAYEQMKKAGHPPDAVIALGCVIKGGTPHFDYVCQSVTQGITALNVQLPIPVIFGVLTVNDEEQAKERAGGKSGHKGKEAALTALKMIAFNSRLSSS